LNYPIFCTAGTTHNDCNTYIVKKRTRATEKNMIVLDNMRKQEKRINYKKLGELLNAEKHILPASIGA
jgi:hypothetical protein